MKQLTVLAPNEPGQFAIIAGALAAASVNIDDFDIEGIGKDGMISLAVDNVAEALRALRDAGYEAVTRETLLIRLEDRPGALAAVAVKLKDAGLDIRSMHIVRRDGKVCLASLVVDDPVHAMEVLADVIVQG